jgi:two-component system, OmpR family, sensor histidine kinase KdpD
VNHGDRGPVWFVIGVVAAVALGVALTPLRTTVSASNLAFVFIAMTIIVAEMGGRGPGLATAVVSALSLNFFLTEPYLSLEIHKPGDIGAFLALAACGLIAAAFGKRRVRTAEQVSRARGDLEVLARTATSLAARAPIDGILEDLRRFFGLGGLVLRRGDERLIAAAPASQAELPPPSTTLDPSTLVSTTTRVHTLGRTGFRFPPGGGRLPLQGREPLVLDVWEGNTEGLTMDERRALAVAALMVALAEPTYRP